MIGFDPVNLIEPGGAAVDHHLFSVECDEERSVHSVSFGLDWNFPAGSKKG